MQRLLVIAAALGAFVAGRCTAPALEARPVVTVKRELTTVPAPAVPCPAVMEVAAHEAEDGDETDDPDAVDIEDTDAMRLLAQESQRLARLEAELGVRGALRGQVRDANTTESLAGVTVIASAGSETQVAITDENGAYELTALVPGIYTVTFYYLDATVEQRDAIIGSHRVTPLYVYLDTTPSVQHIQVERHFDLAEAPDDEVMYATIAPNGDVYVAE